VLDWRVLQTNDVEHDQSWLEQRPYCTYGQLSTNAGVGRGESAIEIQDFLVQIQIIYRIPVV
jgi:hypothetical protein